MGLANEDDISNYLPIEVKYKKEVRASDTRGIKKFLELYRAERERESWYVINLGRD